jgi:PHD finger-like domain-containing protein 5A
VQVRICDECNYGSFAGKCVVCGGNGNFRKDNTSKSWFHLTRNLSGVSDAYYCRECTSLEKDRDGCPKIVNLGMAKMDRYYDRKKYGGK